MISKIIYNLCNLLTTPYEDFHLLSNNVDYLDNSILQSIYLKKLSKYYSRKKIKSSFKNFHSDYSYNILEENLNLIKVELKLKTNFIVVDISKNIISACIYYYIIILENLQNKFKLQLIVENEEFPILYNHILNTPLPDIYSLIFSKDIKASYSDLTSFKSDKNDFRSHNSFSVNNINNRNTSYFNIDKACEYAETYALNTNPNYKSFDGIGGDCTNFMSQIFHAGGIKLTSTWKPYTNSWIRVEEIYSYLTSHNLCTKIPNDNLLDRGCLIQFYTPSIGKFFHNGFITYKLQNNDCLYCCHSYNKLNYPLSEIYPNRYPKLRAVKFV